MAGQVLGLLRVDEPCWQREVMVESWGILGKLLIKAVGIVRIVLLRPSTHQHLLACDHQRINTCLLAHTEQCELMSRERVAQAVQ